MKLRTIINEMSNKPIKVSQKIIDTLFNTIKSIAADEHLVKIEKMVKIAETMSGQFIGKNGKLLVYRSPNNRTLLAVKGLVGTQEIHIADLSPAKVLHLLEKII